VLDPFALVMAAEICAGVAEAPAAVNAWQADVWHCGHDADGTFPGI
jgi:hypothetical protein